MRLLLNPEEMQAVAGVLEQRSRELMSEIVRTERRDLRCRLASRQRTLEELENKLTVGEQFNADELATLAEELSQGAIALMTECVNTSRRSFRDSLKQRERLLQRVRSKLTEACGTAAMN